GDPDVVDPPAVVGLQLGPGAAQLLVRRRGVVELPPLGDPADAHALPEIGGKVELGLHPVAGAGRAGDAGAGAAERGALVVWPAARGPDALRPAHRLVHAARGGR